ncbi:hypothetical protein J3R83DRAFT_2004 [Lanmaoa asiatica]|nr:hypothetical protein J3R83DRAFT_2004 [Lanmaoa asiatica]
MSATGTRLMHHPTEGGNDSLQSPDRLPVAVVAQRRIMKANAVGSPVRRSPRLSCLPPPPPPAECRDTQDSSDDESESVNDVYLHLSREETPETDALPPDEPSTVLANRIIRAHDNPSPPPQDLAHPGINYVPGKDGQFPLPGAPPSPFRPINLLEQLNQLSGLPFGHSRSSRTLALGDRPEIAESGIISPRDFIPPESCSPFVTSVTSVPMKSTPREDLVSADTVPPSSTQCIVDDLPSRSSRHVCEPNLVDDPGIDPSSQPVAGRHGQLITMTSSLDPDVFSSSPAQVVDSSLNPVIPPASDDCPQEPSQCSGWQSCRRSSPLASKAKTLSSPPSNETGKASLATETVDSGRKDNDREEILSIDNNSLSVLKGEQESKCRAASAKGVGANSHQRLSSLSPHSTNVLAGLCSSLEPTSSIEQTILPVDTIPIKAPPATPSRTPRPSVTHPDFSRSTVRRPIITPTPVRANNGPRKLNSPVKFSLEVDDIYRTPAQRVPIETAFARGTSSFQRAVQLSTGSDQSQLGRFLTIRAPVFTRPALDDPSRSPAKRIPVADLVASPTRGDRAPSSPTRLGLRARSASAEPRPLGPTLTRSRSVEPCTMISKSDNHGKMKESIFPMVLTLPRSGTKLPFPLVPGQKSNSDLPAPIPEERETAEIGNTGTDATLGRVTQGNTMSQLRQPSTSSRIPRIGNKPYARPPPQNEKLIMGTTTANAARAPKASPFQLACGNDGTRNNNMEVSSTQSANNQRLVGSLKRKRGVEATAPSNSHPVMIRQVFPGILSGKYAPKPAKFPSKVQSPSEPSPPKVPQPLKFRKVVDGMLSARYAPTKANLAKTELVDPTSLPPSPLSELSSSSNEGSPDENLPPTAHPPARPKRETSDTSRTDGDASVAEPSTHDHSLHQDVGGNEPCSRPRRTFRTRKPAQQQYVLDVFSGNTSTRRPPARRKLQSRTEGDGFMGMSATALKALTASNTTKNQQTVALLATEVIRKEGLRPESPTVKARTILQKQRDERDMRRRERAQRRAQMSEEGLGVSDTEGPTELNDRVSLGTRAEHDENDYAMPPKHRRGPGDEEDYETPERLERIIEPLRLEGADTKVKPVKQVKWHRELPNAVHLDEADPRPKSFSKGVVVVRGCLAFTSKNLPLDPLGNLADIDNRPSPKLVPEQIVVKKYLYDNEIEPEPIPAKMTRSKSKKSRS